MIHGDDPWQIGEGSGVNQYTYAPDINAIRQSANLYSYALNNPIMYRDPSGRFVITAAVLKAMLIGAVVGAIVGGGIDVTGQVMFQDVSSLDELDWRSVAVATGIGAVSGAFGGSTLGLGAMLAVNATLVH